MAIKEIAQKLAPGYWKRDQWNIEYFDSVGFAEALIESYKAELPKEVQGGQPDLGEPVAYFSDEFFSINTKQNATFNEPLYTSDQLAAAVLKATKPLEDQLAKAEQRVAEACALQVATEIRFHWLDAARVAKEIRSGEWKRYLK